MRYFELMANNPLIWGLFIFYLAGTSWLAYLGHKKTGDLKSFALGKGDMNPIIVGVTLAAAIASTATFVINPGFVYVHGLSALIHLGGAAGVGVISGLLIMSIGFRRIGQKTQALTLPQWIGQRYGSRWMTTFFAGVNLLSLTFVVLIVGGLSIVMQITLGLSNTESIILIIGFVFSYIFVGGTYAHAYTNTLQGIIMTIIAAVIVFSGLHFFMAGLGPVSETLAAQDPNLIEAINPESFLFGSFFSVYVSGFIIGFAIVSQPHIMIKALYVKEDKHVWQYLAVCIAVSLFFTALLLVGLYARLMEIPVEKLVDPTTGIFRQDLVMTVYVAETFSPTMIAVVSVALLAAGMSTLDGILIALSSIAANDLFLGLTRNNLLKDKTPTEQHRIAHRAGQVILIVLGLITFAIALNPPELLGIFGQVGVYGIVAASCVPILFGILFPRVRGRGMFASAIVGLGVHLGLYAWAQVALAREISLNAVVEGWGPLAIVFDTKMTQLGFFNPGVTATYGIIASLIVGLVAVAVASSPKERA
ncbi:MAG: sodium:solute symporter family transporter [Bradymonadaceae bacterium]